MFSGRDTEEPPRRARVQYPFRERPSALARLVQPRLGIFEHNAVLHDREVEAWMGAQDSWSSLAIAVGSVVQTSSHGA